MWLAVILGTWVVGSISLYTYLVATAKEPQAAECFDCRKMDCDKCSVLSSAKPQMRRAA